jgi:hypothetical protein
MRNKPSRFPSNLTLPSQHSSDTQSQLSRVFNKQVRIHDRNNATNMHGWPGQPGHLPLWRRRRKRILCSASSEGQVVTHIVPLASWQLASGKSVTGLLPPFRSVLVDTVNTTSQADDLAPEEKSPSLWLHFYRTDVNVYATGRQKFAWCTLCHDLDKPPANFRHAL